ncbi:hypothetical protein DYB32_005858 [Aphanomyces invadans]|uniref:EF-hand domain-containing protein n=1 Tax=Aphanomyces invadans TaxID=157072 RepID=A0A3R6Y7A2_9STRA|nr:hypothetical protein DYB32_005858 [Aphanomyces invadans]
MSTLTSADMGELKRPSTRLHAPPGGGTSWSFGDDSSTADAPKAKAKGRGGNSGSNVTSDASPFSHFPPPAPTSASSATSNGASVPAAPAGTVAKSSSNRRAHSTARIAVLKTKTDEHVVDDFAVNFTRALAPSVSYEMVTVPSIEDLPYAANKLAVHGGFDGVVVFGLLNTSDALFSVYSTSILSALIQISIAAVKPIVRAIFVGEPRVASVKAKGGYGAEFAATIEDLVQLGGFIHRPTSTASVSSSLAAPRASAHHATAADVHADNNVFPDAIKSAPRSVQDTLAALRASLYEHGARGIVGLGRKFRIMDDDNSRTLDLGEFTKAIREHALNLSKAEVADLFAFFDDDRSGQISYDEFLVGIRGELNDRRQQLVLLAFAVVDADGNGILELDDIIAKYNADKHPDVISGKRTKHDVFREFLDTFDGGEKDGKVHPSEFLRYYANLSASIDDDDYFELMIRNAWHISGGEGWSANSTCRRVLVTLDDGTQRVEEVKNDIGIHTKEAIAAALKAQGTVAATIATSGYVENVTKAPKPGKKLQHGAGDSSIVFG